MSSHDSHASRTSHTPHAACDSYVGWCCVARGARESARESPGRPKERPARTLHRRPRFFSSGPRLNQNQNPTPPNEQSALKDRYDAEAANGEGSGLGPAAVEDEAVRRKRKLEKAKDLKNKKYKDFKF